MTHDTEDKAIKFNEVESGDDVSVEGGLAPAETKMAGVLNMSDLKF